MRTAVRRVLLLSALMSPGVLQALGLGDIHLNSSLNQPFDAEIELVSATSDDLGALRASLASGETFTRYGLDRPAFLSEFSFRVTKGEDGKDVLRVTSPRAITEPFVTLLVEANWPRGRLLREYTVLLDPPVYAPTPSPAQQAAVATPRVASGAGPSVRSSEPAPIRNEIPAEQRPQRALPTPSAGIEPGSTYKVRPNDTLWRIASSAHPGRRSDVNRAMVSIYQQNPTAFEGNINVLRSGSTLRIPQADEVASVSAAAASAEVARQYTAWRDGRASSGTAAASGADAGRLRLVTPEQGTTAPSTATAAPAAAATRTPPADGTAPGATTAAAGAASLSVDARVKQLETELAEARRLLEVRNAELATMQGGAAPAAAETAPTGPDATAPAGAEAEAPAGEPAPTATAPAATPVTAAPAKVAKPADAAPAPVAPAGPTLLERILGYWWVLVALLAAAAGAMLFKRMRAQRGSAEAELEDALARDLRSATRTSAVTRPRDASGIVVEEKRAHDTHRAAPAAATTAAPALARVTDPARKPVTVEDTISGDGPASMESGDPLAEADFHMAYGLYDQAADLVQLAMKREPKRRDLKLKLLEIFFVWGNKDRFLQLAGELNSSRAEGPAGEWDKVMIMGKQIAQNDPMFTGAAISAGSALDLELHGSTGTLDMSLFSGDSPAPDLDVGTMETSRVDSSGIDFILDEPVRGTDEDPNAGPTVETPQVRGPIEDPSTSPTIETPQVRGPVEDSSTGPTVETPQLRRGVLEDTQEVPVESLALDINTVRGLETLDSPDTIVVKPRSVSAPAVAANAMRGDDEELDVDLDMIGSTALMKMSEDTQEMLRAGEPEAGEIDLSDSTGFIPMLESVDLNSTEMLPSAVDYDLGGEPATMSEVGTKLDLARAYMDMGDPEGARSILDEVLEEGSSGQRQEAERLIASLP